MSESFSCRFAHFSCQFVTLNLKILQFKCVNLLLSSVLSPQSPSRAVVQDVNGTFRFLFVFSVFH